MAYFPFICKLPGGSKFGVERADISDTNELLRAGVFCPCHGKRWGEPESKIEYDMAPPSVTRTLSMRSKENAEASREAEEQARRDREMLSRENPEVMPGVRKSAIDTINERANDII